MKKVTTLITFFVISFLIYNFFPSDDKETQVVPVSQPTDDEKIQVAEPSKTSKINKSEKPDQKIDLEKIWASLDREVPVASYLNELLSEAEQNNPYAKYHLSYIHRFCSYIPEDKEDLDNKLSQNQNPRAIQEMTDAFIFCEGYPRDILSKKDVINMIMDSARKGNPKAKVEFAAVAFEFDPSENVLKNAELIVELKQEAVQHLFDAKRMGEQDALYSLARAYKHGDLIEKIS